MRIAIVNDLRLAVESLKRVVASHPGATVAWIAEDGAQAVAKCAQDRPDMLLMDMIMPVMDGVEATRRIMKATPCPIIVVTATVEGNSSKVFEALGAGALDAVATPGIAPDGSSTNAGPLLRKIREVGFITGAAKTSGPASPTPADAPAGSRGLPPLLAIGSSTGGPQALSVVLKAIPKPLVYGVVIVQHIDPVFASGLAEWLARETHHAVEIARPNAMVTPGVVLLANTSDHLIVDSSGRLSYTPDPVELVYRPSVDVFYDSIRKAKAQPGVAVLLTGMGRDGAAGMGRLRAIGWHTIAQDEATSVVWGMPGAAAELKAAVEVLPLDRIAASVTARMKSLTASPKVPTP